MSTLYLTLALIFATTTLFALIPAQRLYWATPVYFMLAWLTGDLALVHILWQVAFTAILAFGGVFDSATAQCGLAVFSLTWLGLFYLHVQASDAHQFLKSGLRSALGDDYRADIPPEQRVTLEDGVVAGHWLRPFTMKRDGVRVVRDLYYGDAGKRNALDIYQPLTAREGGHPILLQVHGGGWMIGEKHQQALPLMYQMAQRGWLCIAINYRLSPKSPFPAHIIDVKKAIAWAREHGEEYGGNTQFIAVTGGSAGGHLSALAAVTPNRQEWQPGFEQADTRVQAAVPFYGVYDFLDRDGICAEMSREGFLSKNVMQCSPQDNPELWDAASPLSHTSSDSPPFFVLHGSHDSLVSPAEARAFVAALRAASEQPVGYAELPGAQHAFDTFHCVRTDQAINAVAEFLEYSYAREQRSS